jgi:hypothetical protein
MRGRVKRGRKVQSKNGIKIIDSEAQGTKTENKLTQRWKGR